LNDTNGAWHYREPMRVDAALRRAELPLLTICIAAALFMLPSRGPDAQLRRRVLDQLRADSLTTHLPLEVGISGGVATVSGEFANPIEHAHVLAVVRHTEGVMDVIDALAISDRVITQRVLNAFRADPALAPIPVTVTSAGGEVTLKSDQTNATQRRQLLEIATAVDGVVHVVDAMK
jgi:osmotically-inducible protein OsmY